MIIERSKHECLLILLVFFKRNTWGTILNPVFVLNLRQQTVLQVSKTDEKCAKMYICIDFNVVFEWVISYSKKIFTWDRDCIWEWCRNIWKCKMFRQLPIYHFRKQSMPALDSDNCRNTSWSYPQCFQLLHICLHMHSAEI